MDQAQREQLLDKTKKALRSVLISAPRGVPAHLLLSDYKKVMGKELPYRALGFSSVEQLVAALGDVVRVAPGPTGMPTLYPVANEKTKQIMRFVATQKKAPLKKSLAPPPTVINKTPAKMAGFTRKTQRFGVRHKPPSRSSQRPQGALLPTTWPHWYGAPPPPGWQAPPPRMQRAPLFPPRTQRDPSHHFTEPNRHRMYSDMTISSTGAGVRDRIVTIKPAGVEPNRDRTVTMKPAGVDLRERLAPKSSGGMDLRERITPKNPAGVELSQTQPAKQSERPLIDMVPWHSSFSQHSPVTIEELNHSPPPSLFPNMVGVVGYYAGSVREVEDTSVRGGTICKILLLTRFAKGRGVFPAVMCVFRQPHWDIKKYPGPRQLEKGAKLKVIGDPQVIVNKKKEKMEPLVVVHYCEACSSSPSSSPLASPAPVVKTPPPLPLKAAGEMEERVYELLKEKPNGVITNRLLKEINNMFKIDAPKDLPEKAKQFSFVECEVITDELSVLHLKKALPPPPLPSEPLPPPPLPSTAVFESSQDIFDVLVSFISSPTSFYVRLLGPQHSEEFVKLETAMTSSLSQRATPPVDPVAPDRLYAYHWRGEGDSMWCRALATSLSADQVEVVFPDYGNTASVAVGELKQLPSEFHQLPFQAIHCCLHGLTEASSQAFDKLCELALDKTCIAQVMDRSGSRVSVELMDSEREGLIINNLLVMELHPIASMSPPLPRCGEPMVPAVLCDVDEFGIATLQLPGPGYTMLQQLMNHINDAYSKKMTASSMVTKPTKDLVCCAKYSHDGQWYRVQIQAVHDKKVVVEYVDYGNEEVLEVVRLRKAPDSDLMALPHQAVKCLLQDLPPPGGEWTEEAIAECYELIGCEDVYVEVLREGEVPVVRLFLEEEGGEKVDLNQRLLQQAQLFLRPAEGAGPESQGPAGEGTPSSRPGSTDVVDDLAEDVLEKCALNGIHEATSILSSRSSVEPQTPPMSPPPGISQSAQSSLNFEQLPHLASVQVLVSSIESPSCFTVQLDSKQDALEDMMSRLAEAASALPRLPLLAVGLVCAACAGDQRWYRVVITAHSTQTVTAEFLDYGGKEGIPVGQLRVLPEELLSLAFQGIPASLHGVSPMDEAGWSDESKAMFKASAFELRLFAVRHCVEEGVNRVTLLDTSKQDTVVLSQQLLDKGLAK